MLAGLGHVADFWASQPRASKRLINTFLASGTVDDSLYKPASVDFTPKTTETGLAKKIAGTMAGLALLAVLSLIWMARRVGRRGGFGRKASATLRSVYLFVLGLGGWFLGALVALTALPGVPLNDELLTVLSVSLPIGLGADLAWVRRDWSGNIKTIGLTAAVAGAIVGAWLGFHATDGIPALITTIVGAAAGANLVLLVFDITRDTLAVTAGP